MFAVTKPWVPTETIRHSTRKGNGGSPPQAHTNNNAAEFAANWMTKPHNKISSALLPLFNRQAVMRLNAIIVTILLPNTNA